MGEAKRRRASGEAPKAGRKSRGPWLLAGAFVIVLLVVAGLLYWITTPTISPLDDLPTAAEGEPPFPRGFDQYGISMGDANAPVVVREFADYQCPACARFHESVQRLKREYVDDGQVRFVFFDLPLEQHKNAMPAAMAARCAGDQDAYWPMHDLLFARQSRWSDASDPQALFARYAQELDLNRPRFEQCMSSRRHRAAIEGSVNAAQRLRIAATPTVFVDNIHLTRPGWYQLSGVVEKQLQAAQK
jgi:protein-disulfide isomerase